MDETTYSNAEVAKQVNEDFVPVRVDIDKRPDISERYNRGGFPTTAFLSDQGESVWGATYVPPLDMLRIMKTILAAKSSGEIDSALERGRLQYLDISKALAKMKLPDSEFVSALFEDIFASYDVEQGGFGLAPKFPHPDVVDLLLVKVLKDGDNEAAEAVRHTIDRMIEGLYDPVEGGVFRYSVKRDWREPHFEKMLETNLGMMRNLVHASAVLDKDLYMQKAEGVATYLRRTLKDPRSGGFFGSQDADEEYYTLSKEQRSKRKPPSVDRTIYAGWNAEAVSTMIESGAMADMREWIEDGLGAWDCAASSHWNQELGLARHTKGQDLYLFEDQAAFLEAIVSVLQVRNDPALIDMGRRLVEGVEKGFSDPEGGYYDVFKGEEAIGELGSPRRTLVGNSRYARALALFGIASHDVELIQRSWGILVSFPSKSVEAHGLFAAQYIMAWWVLEREPVLVEVHNAKGDDPLGSKLWLTAKRTMNQGLVAMLAPRQVSASSTRKGEFAVVCTRKGCSKELATAAELLRNLRSLQSSQV